MAAAPELLAALKAIHDHPALYNSHVPGKLLETASAAIACATGEEPK